MLQWHVKGRSPVCFLIEMWASVSVGTRWRTGGGKNVEGRGGGACQRRERTYLMCLARCSLLLKTILHSP